MKGSTLKGNEPMRNQTIRISLQTVNRAKSTRTRQYLRSHKQALQLIGLDLGVLQQTMHIQFKKKQQHWSHCKWLTKEEN